MFGDGDVVGEVDSEPLSIFRLSSFNLGLYGSLLAKNDLHSFDLVEILSVNLHLKPAMFTDCSGNNGSFISGSKELIFFSAG